MENKRYAGGDELLNPDFLLREVLEIPFGARVADLGCGSMGYFVLQAAKLAGDKGRVYACDILKDVLSAVSGKARQEGLINVKTVWTNLEIVGATKIEEPLDYALLINTLFQATKHAEMLAEAYRLLKSEGKLLVVEWHASSGPLGPSANLRLAKETVDEMAQSAGFAKIREFEAGQNHYGLIFQKP